MLYLPNMASEEKKSEEKGERFDVTVLTPLDPHDVSRCEMWRGVLFYLKLGGYIPGWEYTERNMKFGYWRNQWYFNNQLIYKEEHNAYYGCYSIDYTTHEVWSATNIRPDEDGSEDWLLKHTDQPFFINNN